MRKAGEKLCFISPFPRGTCQPSMLSLLLSCFIRSPACLVLDSAQASELDLAGLWQQLRDKNLWEDIQCVCWDRDDLPRLRDLQEVSCEPWDDPSSALSFQTLQFCLHLWVLASPFSLWLSSLTVIFPQPWLRSYLYLPSEGSHPFNQGHYC